MRIVCALEWFCLLLSRIFEAVHETASDLHRLGFIDKRKMRKYDALCLEPVPAHDSKKIRALRDHLVIFATGMGVWRAAAVRP